MKESPRVLSFAVAATAILVTVASSHAENPPAQSVTLQDLERMALEHNPTIGQAKAGVDMAAGRVKQAGLYPNPVVSAVGEEISGGPIIRGGEFGAGIQQRIVTAGKLGLSRQMAGQERAQAEQIASAQRQRVLNAVRSLYYQALGDQYLIQVRTALAKLADEAVRVSAELMNVGQADQPDQLSVEVQAQQIQLELVNARTRQERTWRQLAAVVNIPALRPVPLDGNLEEVPRLQLEEALAQIYSESPELRSANIDTTRSELALRLAKKEKIPDIVVTGGVRYNRELLESVDGGAGRRPVGREGFFDIGVEIPIFNRNQGNVATARADVERTRLEVERTRLALRSRFAEAYREYSEAVTAVDRYKQEMLPKAQRAYQLYLDRFRQMAAAYPQVLITQRNLFQLQDAYVSALVTAWQRSVDIQGLLLTGGVDLSGVGLGNERMPSTSGMSSVQ